MNHPAEKTLSGLPEADKCLMLKPCNTNGFSFVGVSLVSWALMLAKTETRFEDRDSKTMAIRAAHRRFLIVGGSGQA